MSSDQTLGQRTSSDPTQVVNCMRDADRNCVECDVCKEDPDDVHVTTSAKRCIECQQNLCSRCIKDHRRQKLLKDHHIVDIPYAVEGEPNQTNSVANSTTEIQHQTSGTDDLGEGEYFERERCKHTEYEKEMSDHIDQLHMKQNDTKKAAADIRQMIHNKYLQCLTRLESDKDSLLEQLNSHTDKLLSENGVKLQEADSYVEKIRDHKTYFETESLQKRLTEVDVESDRSLLLHVHFQRPIKSQGNVSFHESFACTEKDNTIGRLEGLANILKIQTAPTLESYMKFLRNVHSRTTDARKLHWKLTMLNEVELNEMYEMNFLYGVHDELHLSITDKKRDELQKGHTRLASFVFEVTKPTSESSAEKYETHLAELQHITEEMWNLIQFQIHYKNSEKGLKPEGFQNFGNTCYFNSVFQCLVQTVLLPFELTPNLYGLANVLTQKEDMSCLSRTFLKLTSNYKVSEQRKETLKALYNKFKAATPRFNDERQHDSHDLLINFLDKLRIEERNEWHKAETQKTLTAVDRIFGGQFITVYTCQTCQDPYGIREPFLDISIPLCKLIPDEKKTEEIKRKPTPFPFEVIDAEQIVEVSTSRTSETCDTKSPSSPMAEMGELAENHFSCETNPPSSSLNTDNSRKFPFTTGSIKNMLQPLIPEKSTESDNKGFLSRLFTNNLNVSQCLKYFTREEEIDSEYLCRNCQAPDSDKLTMTSATKRTLISSPPAVLVLHLKRFEQRSSGFGKRDEMISYDELLDLGSSCCSGALRINPEEENVWYSLYGVVVHNGFFLSRGHYVAYVKQRDSGALLDDQLREKFLQKNLVDRESDPNNDDSATLMKGNAIRKREKAKPPNPIPGQWFYISDDSVRRCAVKEALDQKAFLLFYERIPGTDG